MLFKRKAQPEPEITLEQRLEAAEREVERANAVLEGLQAELAEKQRQYGLMLGPGGVIAHCDVEGPAQGAKLERWAHEFVGRRYRAEQGFYRSLQVWAGLKGV